MTLPDICPRDGASSCKRTACHLYVVDWRSGDEQCIIGYRSTHKGLSKSSPVVDSYAQDTRRKLGDKRNPESLEPHQKARQPEEVRHIDSLRGSEVSSREEVKPVCFADVSSAHLLKEAAANSCDEAKSWQCPDVQSRNACKGLDTEMCEEVTVNTKNTTVIESREAPQREPPKKRKSLDDVMNLDLPDNYEEEFWK
jgi:hypothetical protein